MKPSIVAQSFARARSTILWGAISASSVLGVLIGYWAFQQFEQGTRYERLLLAEKTAGQIMLADERLTMSAYLAAVSGNTGWITRYNQDLPLIDEAIAQAKSISPLAVRQRLHAETHAANDRLVALEQESFAAVRIGNVARAQSILNSAAYVESKRILSAGHGSEVRLTAL